MREHSQSRLSDVAEIVMGQSPPGETVSHDVGFPLLNGPTEFGSYCPSPVQFTTDPRRFAREGDILFCVRGSTTGRMNWADRDYAIGRGVAAIRHKNDRYLQHLVHGVIEHQLPGLLVQATGSTFPNVSREHLQAIPFPDMPLETQKQVSSVFKALDDRIELNRRMCVTLEEMAQALFKSWFVDFEPVRAKMDGRWREGESLPGLPAHLYDYFPDDLVGSELGPIPTGWHIESLGTVLQLAYGRSLPASMRNDGTVPVMGSNGQVGWHDKKLVDGPGVVVGRKGNPGTVIRVSGDFFPIDTTFYVALSDERLSQEFVYCALKSLDLASIGTDSAVPGLNRNLAYMSRLLIPNKDASDTFAQIASEFWRRQHVLELKSISLTETRDRLLPKLISGEVRLPELGEVIEC